MSNPQVTAYRVELETHARELVSRGVLRPMLCVGEPYGPQDAYALFIAAQLLHCTEDALHAHPDYISLGADQERVDVDAVRELVMRTTRTPIRSARQVVVIHHAEQLTLSAANVLLKALEEHREHVVWMLTTATPEMMIDTVRSRCEEYVAPNWESTGATVPFFQLAIDAEKSSEIAQAAQESIRFWNMWNTKTARRIDLKRALALWDDVDSLQYPTWGIHLDLGIATLMHNFQGEAERLRQLDFLHHLRHTLKNHANTTLIFESVICNMNIN